MDAYRHRRVYTNTNKSTNKYKQKHKQVQTKAQANINKHKKARAQSWMHTDTNKLTSAHRHKHLYKHKLKRWHQPSNQKRSRKIVSALSTGGQVQVTDFIYFIQPTRQYITRYVPGSSSVRLQWSGPLDHVAGYEIIATDHDGNVPTVSRVSPTSHRH